MHLVVTFNEILTNSLAICSLTFIPLALKIFIEHEKKNLLFYSLYWDILAQKTSEGKLEKQIDLHLDRLLLLLKLKG